MNTSYLTIFGAASFGLVIGWSTSLAILKAPKFGLTQLAALIAAIGGGAVTALFKAPDLFGAYSIGLALAFFSHRILSHKSVAKLIDEEIKKA